MSADFTITSVRSAMGGAQPGEALAVGVAGGFPCTERQVMQSLHATDGGDRIIALFVKVGQFAKHGRFTGRIAALDEMFRRVVEATFGFHRLAAVKKDFSQLAIGAGEPLFVPDDTMGI